MIQQLFGGMIMNVMIVDQRKRYRENLKRVLANHPEIRFVCEQDSIFPTVSCITRTKPDILVIDPSMYRNLLPDYLRLYVSIRPRLKIIFLPSSEAIDAWPRTGVMMHVREMDLKTCADYLVHTARANH